jgi:dynactin complex subunit
MATNIITEPERLRDLLQFLGTRINFNKFRGTVKYVGPVDNSSGIWLGVEWDDPERGKHDGKGYFRTEQVQFVVGSDTNRLKSVL